MPWNAVGNLKGPKGDTGDSPYEIAVANGFVGTEAEWLASLEGLPGEGNKWFYEVTYGSTYAGTFPNLQTGDYHLGLSPNFALHRWDGDEWAFLGFLKGDPGEDGLGVNGGSIYIQETAPATPALNDIWIW